ncbi:hypothetical protein [Streptomyces huiliensis]|uniref:hypothetical protein n=1 Tax=Streptomyces huiliensis TaxID=2876027 RepID=UPI001CBED725|nr:hypothetical protein [Streptomyces huiliensis]MBZ4322287.1 hypothetical protein [Streptomyces huiliensis]
MNPSWRKPAPLGWSAAREGQYTTAAPLLGGASITLLGLVITDRDTFRWPDPTLLALALTAFFMVMAVVWGVRSRQYLYSRGDVEAWWGPLSELSDERHEELVEDQRRHYATWTRLAGRADFCYSSGLLCLTAGSSLALVPPAHAAAPAWRWLAAATMALPVVVVLLAWVMPYIGSAIRAWPADSHD